MGAHGIDFVEVDALVAALKATGIASVTTNPPELNLPGVLVELERIRFDLLDGATLVLRVTLIAPNTGTRRGMEHLAELLNRAGPLLDPEGDVIATTVALPEQSAPMPALQILHALPIT